MGRNSVWPLAVGYRLSACIKKLKYLFLPMTGDRQPRAVPRVRQNCDVLTLRDGIKRVVNELDDFASSAFLAPRRSGFRKK